MLFTAVTVSVLVFCRYHRCEFHLAVPPDARQQSADAGQLIDVSPPGPIMVRCLLLVCKVAAQGTMTCMCT